MQNEQLIFKVEWHTLKKVPQINRKLYDYVRYHDK